MKRKFNIWDFVKITGRFKSNITGVQDTIKEGVEVNWENSKSFNGVCGYITDIGSAYQVNTKEKDGIYLGMYSARELTKITEEEHNEYYNPKPIVKNETTMQTLPEEYIVVCNKPSREISYEILIHYYGTSQTAFGWQYLICSKRINYGKFKGIGNIPRSFNREDKFEDIYAELKSLPKINYKDWVKLKNVEIKQEVKQENKMNKQKFAVSGCESLIEAFAKEVGVELYSFDTLTDYAYLIPSEVKENTLCGYKTSFTNGKNFKLPKDWDVAVAYAREYFKKESPFKIGDWVINEEQGIPYQIKEIDTDGWCNGEVDGGGWNPIKLRKATPEEIEKASTKTLNFGDVEFTIEKGDNFATTPFGKVTREEIRDAIEYITNPPTLSGYRLTIHISDSYKDLYDNTPMFSLGFGCKAGKLSELEAILKAFD